MVAGRSDQLLTTSPGANLEAGYRYIPPGLSTATVDKMATMDPERCYLHPDLPAGTVERLRELGELPVWIASLAHDEYIPATILLRRTALAVVTDLPAAEIQGLPLERPEGWQVLGVLDAHAAPELRERLEVAPRHRVPAVLRHEKGGMWGGDVRYGVVDT
jgi:hypothetical protein